jgi:hypothetical protein
MDKLSKLTALFLLSTTATIAIQPARAANSSTNGSGNIVNSQPTNTDSFRSQIGKDANEFNSCIQNPKGCAPLSQGLANFDESVEKCKLDLSYCVNNSEAILTGVKNQFVDAGNQFIDAKKAEYTQVAMDKAKQWGTNLLNDMGLGSLAGMFGLGDNPKPPTIQEINAKNPSNTSSIATQAGNVAAVENYINANKIGTSEYRSDIGHNTITKTSEIIANSETSARGIANNSQVVAISSQNVTTASNIANKDVDSSLDAISNTNKILTTIAAQNDLIVGGAMDAKLLQAQNLKQSVALQRTLQREQDLEERQAARYKNLAERTNGYISGMNKPTNKPGD